jgi:hypothetical protein
LDHTTLRREQLDDNGMGPILWEVEAGEHLSGRISLPTVSSIKVTGLGGTP